MEMALAKSETLFANHQIQMEHALNATSATFSTMETVFPSQSWQTSPFITQSAALKGWQNLIRALVAAKVNDVFHLFYIQYFIAL